VRWGVAVRQLGCDAIGAEQWFWHVPHLTLTLSAPRGGEGNAAASRCAHATRHDPAIHHRQVLAGPWRMPPQTPSPPLGAERAGVRWGVAVPQLGCDAIGAEQWFWHVPHLTLTLSAPKGGEGIVGAPRCVDAKGQQPAIQRRYVPHVWRVWSQA
jgi:hypothetical protein